MKKLFIITLIIVVSLLNICFAYSRFPDVNGTKYEVAVTKLSNAGIIDGFTDGTFKPDNSVTRAQFCKLLVTALELKRTNYAPVPFTDINDSQWFYNDVKIAIDNGIIVGYSDGTFRPNDDVKYSEMITMIIRAMKRENQIANKSNWPSAYENYASAYGLLSNVSYANIKFPATRGEVSVALYNMVNRLEAEEYDSYYRRTPEPTPYSKVTTEYGLVDSTSIKSKTKYVKIDGETYEVSSDSDTFSKDTFVVYDYHKKYDTVSLVESYGVKNLDADADVVTYVSGKQGDQILRLNGNSKNVDYFTSSSISRYSSYAIALINIKADSDGDLYITKCTIEDELEDIKFVKGDRIIEDSKTKVFLVFRGLESNDVVKKGKLLFKDDEYYTITYKWASGAQVSGVSLPKSDTVAEGTKYTIRLPEKDGYEFYARDYSKDTFYVYEDTIIYIESKELGGYAGKNIPLIDRVSEDTLKQAIRDEWHDHIIERYGSDVKDISIKSIELIIGDNKDEVKFEIVYHLKPSSNSAINRLTIPDGTADRVAGWVTDKHNVGVLRSYYNDSRFSIDKTSIGTGF